MPRALSDGRKRLTLLTTKPADPAKPTASELNAGIDASCAVLASDYAFGPTDSDKLAERSLCQENNANSLGAGNAAAAWTVFREFDANGDVDPMQDIVFQTLKVKDTEVWAYERHTGKKSGAAWVGGDECRFGARLRTDEPQPPSDQGGYIKARIVMEPQETWSYFEVGPAPVPTIVSVSPSTGTDAGGTAVTITGTAFTGATGVLFGSNAGTAFTVVSPTQITVTSPAGTAGAVSVVVQHPNGNATEANGFTYTS